MTIIANEPESFQAIVSFKQRVQQDQSIWFVRFWPRGYHFPETFSLPICNERSRVLSDSFIAILNEHRSLFDLKVEAINRNQEIKWSTRCTISPLMNNKLRDLFNRSQG